MKPKSNRRNDDHTKRGMDDCQTPPYALDPLWSYLERYAQSLYGADYQKTFVIWEPATGDGYLADELQSVGYRVIRSDIKTGQSFFAWQPEAHWDIIVTNPPYSRPDKYNFVRQCYAYGKPWALLMQLENLGAGEEFQPHIFKHGCNVMLLDKRVDYIMPFAGVEGNGAQFPSAWFTWGLGVRGSNVTLTRGFIKKRPVEQKFLPGLATFEQLALDTPQER